MDRTRIAQLYADQTHFGGQQVTVAGWVRSIRDMKDIAFITLNDGSCFKNLQVVMDRSKLDNYSDVASQGVGASMIIAGQVVLTPNRPQPLELHAQKITVAGVSGPDYPLQKQHQSREFLRTVQHLRPRTNLFRAVFRIRSVAAYAIHTFFQSRGFVYVNTPLITTSDAEGAGEMFQVTTLDLAHVPTLKDGSVDWSKDFFGKQARLTVSGQLQAENFAMAFGDVYTFGPTFRAEDSNTRRHAAEFWMIEPEMAFTDLAGEMQVSEDMLKFVIRTVLDKCPDEMAMLNKFVDKGLVGRLEHVANSAFARISYTDAIKILQDAEAHGAKFVYHPVWGQELQTEHERYLAEKYAKKPTFVTDYPRDIKAFYMRQNEDGKTVAAADCLAPGLGEIIGGSQREERYDVLLQRMKDLHMNIDEYQHYLDLRKYGTCKHAGFGLGFERLIMYLTGVDNIRDVIPHPREPGNAEF
jgi:asparaginyl-tRNA synthetase